MVYRLPKDPSKNFLSQGNKNITLLDAKVKVCYSLTIFSRGETAMYEKLNDSFLPTHISDNRNNMVVQHNGFIKARQALGLNESKLIRIVIAQILKDDMDFKPYVISRKEFCNMLQLAEVTNIGKEAESICTGIMRKPIEMRTENGSWVKMPWVTKCAYNSETNDFLIQLNEELKPWLLNLTEKGYYTQYMLETALDFTSVYAVRIYELLMANIMNKSVPQKGAHVSLTLDDIRDACDLYVRDNKGKIQKSKYGNNVSNIREKVIKIAVREIEDKTTYVIDFKDIKKGNKLVGFDFFIAPAYGVRKQTRNQV